MPKLRIDGIDFQRTRMAGQSLKQPVTWDWKFRPYATMKGSLPGEVAGFALCKS